MSNSLKNKDLTAFIPMTPEEMKAREWKDLDILLITGDAYVDHPSFGIAILSRLLEHEGYKVGIMAQPLFPNSHDGVTEKKAVEYLKRLGTPQLFIGITSGVVDSMLNNYTANKDIGILKAIKFFPCPSRQEFLGVFALQHASFRLGHTV